MKRMHRRDFIALVAAGSAGLLAPRTAAAADARVEVLIDEPIGLIAPDIYGHFIEHLGGVIYDGIWVGEDSKVPNIGGLRTAVVEHMRRLKPGVVRWPGGCFADSYNWRDGVGPRRDRPRRTNFWANSTGSPGDDRFRRLANGPQKYEPNHFGTNEFIRFCRLIGARPYLAVNLRSLRATDFHEWVEYCNAPARMTTLSDLRAAAGEPAPFQVRYWGVGNEPWGCGGQFSPEDYAIEYRRFVAWVPRYDVALAFIAAGPNGGDLAWTRRFFTKMAEKGLGQFNTLYGWALHYYCGTTGQGNASVYTTDEWYDLIGRADRMDSLITQHWAIMGEADAQHRVKLVVDEWGAWHRQAADLPDSFLFGYAGTLRDALISALTLDTFNRHADKVVMANVAQLVNTIHSLFVTYEDKFVATPNFHVFEMYAAHQGGTALRTVFSAPGINYRKSKGEAGRLWGLAGSASRRDRQLVLTVVNPHATEAQDAQIALRGATARSCRARTLKAADIHARNTFDRPSAVEPSEAEVRTSGGSLVYRFPPASVTRLQIDLG